MFKKTYRNIYLSLLLPAALFAVLTVFISGAIVSSMLYDTYVSMAVQKLNRSISSCRNYGKSVMLSAGSLAEEAEIITELTSGTGKSITATLDNACNYALKINAITVYATDGRIYTSSNVAQVPELAQLKQNRRLNDFFTLDTSDTVSLRKEYIAKIYNNTPYNTDMGIVTCCQKVYDASGTVIGYIFADIFSSNLYRYFDYANDSIFGGSLALIRFDGTYFPAEGVDAYLEDFLKAEDGTFKSRDRKYLIVTGNRNLLGGTIRLAVPLDGISRTQSLAMSFIISTGVLILVAVHLAAHYVARSVDKRLSRLLKKMEQADS